jgi:uncharacterized protein YcaQ
MPEPLRITPAQARHALLTAQGLAPHDYDADPAAEVGPAEVLSAIRRMHALQIDTISVVARSPYLVLWSRLGDYEPALLDSLLSNHTIFEHWSHAACFLDIADYPLYRRMMLASGHARFMRGEAWLEENAALVGSLLAHIRERGPVRSADFARPDGQKGSGWWDWKAEKLALELLNTRGDLMITARHNFQRIYDLRERVLPDWDDADAPDLETAQRTLTIEVVRSLGVARPEWVRTNLGTLNLGLGATRARLELLADAGELLRVEVEGWRAPAYIHPDNLPHLDAPPPDVLPRTSLLSPFDPITWDRARALELFGFDYKIECYTPAPKRKYGYFTLPILHGDALVGRLDPKAHRKDGVFEVKSIHLEPDVAITDGLVTGLRETLARIAAWHRTPEVIIGATYPAKLRAGLTKKRRSMARIG